VEKGEHMHAELSEKVGERRHVYIMTRCLLMLLLYPAAFADDARRSNVNRANSELVLNFAEMNVYIFNIVKASL